MIRKSDLSRSPESFRGEHPMGTIPERDRSGIGPDDEPARGHEPPTTGPLFVLAHAVEHAAQLERDAEAIREKLLLNPNATLTPQAAELLTGATASAIRAAFALAKLVEMVEPPLATWADAKVIHDFSEARLLREFAAADERVIREHDTRSQADGGAA